MWYNKKIPITKLTKGDIFMPKGQPNKRYTPEFKIKVVETMRDEKLSYKEAARQFDVSFDTPISNSMCELYTMMRYLQADMLKDCGINHFDEWAADFGEVKTDYDYNLLCSAIKISRL